MSSFFWRKFQCYCRSFKLFDKFSPCLEKLCRENTKLATFTCEWGISTRKKTPMKCSGCSKKACRTVQVYIWKSCSVIGFCPKYVSEFKAFRTDTLLDALCFGYMPLTCDKRKDRVHWLQKRMPNQCITTREVHQIALPRPHALWMCHNTSSSLQLKCKAHLNRWLGSTAESETAWNELRCRCRFHRCHVVFEVFVIVHMSPPRRLQTPKHSGVTLPRRC